MESVIEKEAMLKEWGGKGVYICKCLEWAVEKGYRMTTYKSTIVSSFFAPPVSHHLAQQARVHLRGGLEHLLRALTQHFGIAIETRKVQAHE